MSRRKENDPLEPLRAAVRQVPILHRAAVLLLRAGKRFAIRTYLRELWVEFRAFLRQRLRRRAWPETKFVIFGQGRSGSSLLVGLLDSHPEIHCEAEIFHRRAANRLLSPWRYINARAVLSPAPVYGCKLKIYQMTEDQAIGDACRFLRELHASGWRIVYLFREDLFRKALSLVVAEERGRFTVRAGEEAAVKQPVRIEPEKVVAAMRERHRYGQLEAEVLREIPHLRITYEKDLRNAERHQATCDRVFEFLGLSSVPVGARLVKTSRDRISDDIVNYDEVVEAVRQTDLAGCLPR